MPPALAENERRRRVMMARPVSLSPFQNSANLTLTTPHNTTHYNALFLPDYDLICLKVANRRLWRILAYRLLC